MPRYYFHIHDGRSEPDEDGTEFADEAAARREAIRFAGRIMDDEAHRIALGDHWHLDVTDEQGRTLFRLDVSLSMTGSEARVLPMLDAPQPAIDVSVAAPRKPV